MSEQLYKNIGVVSERSPQKPLNEDYVSYHVNELSDGKTCGLYVIADGMGGHTHGDFASFYAGSKVEQWWHELQARELSFEALLASVFEEMPDVFKGINAELIEKSETKNLQIGTTLSVLLQIGIHYYICHIGDTRIYKYNELLNLNQVGNTDTIDLHTLRSFQCVTRDDTWSQKQYDSGALSLIDAESHQHAHALTQCIGIKGAINPYVVSGNITLGDQFLLCTDGLHSLFDDRLLENHLRRMYANDLTEQEVAESLIEISRQGRYSDDVTALIVRPILKGEIECETC